MKTTIFFLLICSSFCSFGQCSNAGIVSFNYNNHNYQLVKTNLRWTEAATCATSLGGYLAEINDENEHLALLNFLDTSSNYTPNNTLDAFGVPSIWLGGTDQLIEGNWIWDGDNNFQGDQFWQGLSNGSSTNNSFNAWGNIIPEPDNSGGDQNYLTWILPGNSVNAGLWNDHHDTPWDPTELYFLVEFDNQPNNVNFIEVKNNITVFPVPAQDQIIIESSNLISSIEIIDISGQTISNMTYNLQYIELDISELKNGIYMLKCHGTNGVIEIQRIVKQ